MPEQTQPTNRPDRNLAMELVRVTEAAAISAARYMGTGNKDAGDQAAVDAMRSFLRTVDMNGTVVIGEGEKDNAPMLYNGELVGTGEGVEVDVAVDPVEGTTLLAEGRPNAIAVIAVAERGSMWNPGNSFYINKIVVGQEARQAIDITKSPSTNLVNIADALGRNVEDLTVFVLDKPRHASLIEEVRQTGARIMLHSDGDVMGALMAAIPGTGIDVLMGVGGTPEAVIAAAAVKALGGGMQAVRAPQRVEEKRQLRKDKVKINEVLHLDDLIQSDNTFFAATGITESTFLEGVHFDRRGGVTTESIVIRSLTGSIRYIKGIHQLNRKNLVGGNVGTTPAHVAMDIILPD
ncbi:class II fructose-bisphosphatase [Phaeodactylibacter luteus]|uniref:Fructose-1,6-bisphosphatase n=1 Tax=Phaeodactylibacter luteus TaxID=1564516 RepID=A0A5C6RZT9_9BACT|nr:class II fructose-bisphosphatase [Phaeodactylibacter luteus]TXB67627.1 class II fructose-bisphosphatase [Phaeodactylibacter luteus]